MSDLFNADIEIFSISFAEGGISVDYALSTDVRVEGRAMRMSTLQLSSDHPDYREDALLLRAQAQRMLKSALADFEESLPFAPSPPPDDDVDGMGRAPEPVSSEDVAYGRCEVREGCPTMLHRASCPERGSLTRGES